MADSALAELVLRITARDAATPALNGVAAATNTFEQRVTKNLQKLAAEYRALGQSEDKAAASAQAMRGQVESAIGTKAEATINRLAPATEKASAAFTVFGAKLQSIGRLAVGFAVGNLAATAAMSVEQHLTNAAEQIDKYGQAALQVQRITGGTAEDSSRLVAVFQRYSGSLDEATTRLARFQRGLLDQESAVDLSETGGKKVAQTLRDIGVHTTDASGKLRSTKDILLDVAGAFQSTVPAAEHAAVAQALFGRGGQSMLLLLNQGRAGLQAAMEMADKYGLTLTGQNLEDVRNFGFAHKDMDMALQGVVLQLGAGFMPAVTTSAQAVAGFAQMMNQTLLPALHAIPLVLPLLTVAMGGLLVGAAVQATIAMTRFAVSGIAVAIQGAIRLAVALAPLIIAFATEAQAALAAAAATVAAWLAAASPIVLVIGGITLAVGALALAMSGKLGEAKDAIGNAIGQIVTAAKNGWDAISKLTTPSAHAAGEDTGEAYGDGVAQGISESAAEKAAKAAKAVVDARLKAVQDAATQRKDTFELSNIEPNRAALETKLDETQASQALIPLKRQLEDLDRGALDYAHQRLVINQDELATQAKIGEEKLKNAADDLSYQEKLLLAQARAAKMRGENVDMDALRSKVLAIRTQQIQNEPGLLVAEHTSAVADRAKSATSLTDQVTKDELEKKKLALKEANQPLEDELVLRTRLAENAQRLLDLNKLNFEINETYYAKDLLLAQAASRAADEAYQKAVDAAAAANIAPGTAPLPAGVTTSSAAPAPVTANVTVNVDTNSEQVAESLKQAAIDGTLEALSTAQRNMVGGTPARHTLPGAFATAGT